MKRIDIIKANNIFCQIQEQADYFLQHKYLKVGNTCIYPKEIEIYYNDGHDFPDNSVHCNELQQNNNHHFYIHRNGVGKNDNYKGGNHPGIDYVVSDSADVFHSYLLRSVKIDDKVIVGPNNVLEHIEQKTNLSRAELENIEIEILDKEDNSPLTLYSDRFNLGKGVADFFKSAWLRLVICDDDYRSTPYPKKEQLVVSHLENSIKAEVMSKNEAIQFANTYLGYLPKSIKEINEPVASEK